MSDNYNNVPSDMQAYNQFIVWKYEQRKNAKSTKVPYCVATGQKASVASPATWCTFGQAVECLRSANCVYDGLGFVFTKTDPFAGVDLDVTNGAQPSDIQQFVFGKLSSYSETSPSGRGLHVIVKGTVPAGRNDQSLGVEIYDSGRYFTMTGNAVNTQPITDRAAELLELWHEIGGVFDATYGEPYQPTNTTDIDDETLATRICGSGKNSAYFNWTGPFDWSNAYRSVLGAACLFSSDEAQVQRVIMASGLVTKAPAHGRETRPRRVTRLWAREYNYACRQGDTERADSGYRIFSRQWFPGGSRELYAEVLTTGKQCAESILAAHTAKILDGAKRARRSMRPNADGDNLPVPLATAGLLKRADLDLTPPTGVFGAMIDEVCVRTRNPSDIMAIWAILGFVSGTVGRAFVTDEGAGVNNFLILSAGSNTGKTQHWSALSTMARISAPNLMDHVLGGDTSSAQIIAKEGQAMGSMALRVPDGGMWLASIMEGRTQISQQLRSALLNIYEAAGEGSEWHIPKSLRAKNDGNHSVSEFNMSIVLDTTPQYVTSFDLSDFTDGLMSRFIMVYGPEVISDLQEPKRGNDVPTIIKDTFDSLAKVYVSCSRPTDPTVGNVPPRMVVAHEQGLQGRDGYMWALEKEITGIIRDVQTHRMPPHYIAASRVILNAKKVAAVVAMIENPAAPIVTRAIFDWALNFVMSSVTDVITMFDKGTMGSDEGKQEAAIMDVLERRIRQHPDTPYVTLAELGKIVDKLACFSRAKMGARFTRQKVLQDLFEREILVKVAVQTNGRTRQVITFNAID